MDHKVPETLFGYFSSLSVQPSNGCNSGIKFLGSILGLKALDLLFVVNPLTAKSDFHQ
jgi:hypothetical protein